MSMNYISQSGGVGFDKSDKNSCSARALANAQNWTLEQGASFMKLFGRTTNKGATLEQLMPAYKSAGFNKVLIFGFTKGANYFSIKANAPKTSGTTFGNLLLKPSFRTGTHIVIITGHAVCIKDGKPVDSDGTFINKNKRVLMTFSKE